MDRRAFLAGSVAILAAAPGLAEAQSSWIVLGTRRVRWGMTRDSIWVSRRTPISALSFRTRGGELFITDIEIFFTRGRSERFPVRTRVRSSSRSNTIHLRTRGRSISRVDFNYRKPSRGRPTTTLELYGRRA